MINITDKQEEIIRDLCADFEKADTLVQKVKVISGEEAVPAVLQLRYAGYHLAQWILTQKDETLDKARAHSKRSVFDAARHGILFCSLAIKKYRDMYGGDILPETVSGYSEKMLKVQKASDMALTEGNEETRAAACENSFNEIKDILTELIACQSDLNKRAEQRMREEYKHKQEENRYKRGLIITIATLTATIAAAIFTAFTVFTPCPPKETIEKSTDIQIIEPNSR